MSVKTNSEQIFETFLASNSVRFDKIEEATSSRPDYLVHLDDLDLIFEVKELEEDENFGVVTDRSRPHIKMHSRTIGDHVRRRIDAARRQVQYGANQGIPSILLIYNTVDPIIQAFGTEDMDFVTAMYGEYTMLLKNDTGENSELFNGRNQLLQERKNTSFSAVGRLRDRGGKTMVTLFENIFAKVKIPYERLPSFFDVKRAELSTQPLDFS
jgi:hypothetical protein